MPCPKIRLKRAAHLFEKLKPVFSIADCITAQTATALGGLSYARAWGYLKALADVGYIEIWKVEKGAAPLNLYCLKNRKIEKIYVYDGHNAYIVKIRDVINAVEKLLNGFGTYTAAVRIRRIKDMLNLPNTAVMGVLLKHLITSVIKDAVIREEVRDSTGAYSIVLVVDRDKALNLIKEYKHGSSFS